MSWFRRRLNRWRNYFSSGDYAGSHGGSSSGSGSTQARAATEGGIHADRMRDSVDPQEHLTFSVGDNTGHRCCC